MEGGVPFADEFGDTLCWYSTPEETVEVCVVGRNEGGRGGVGVGALGDVGVQGGDEGGDEALDVEHGRARCRPETAGDVEGVEGEEVGGGQWEGFDVGEELYRCGGGGGEGGEDGGEVGHGIWRRVSRGWGPGGDLLDTCSAESVQEISCGAVERDKVLWGRMLWRERYLGVVKLEGRRVECHVRRSLDGQSRGIVNHSHPNCNCPRYSQFLWTLPLISLCSNGQ